MLSTRHCISSLSITLYGWFAKGFSFSIGSEITEAKFLSVKFSFVKIVCWFFIFKIPFSFIFGFKRRWGLGKFPNKVFGRPKAVLAPTNRRASIFGDLGFGYPKAVLAPTNGRTSIFGDLGFGYPKPMLASTRRQMEQASQKAFVMTKAVLAPTDRQTFLCRCKRNLTLILLHKIQTRASVFASFHTWFRFNFWWSTMYLRMKNWK